MEPNRSNESRVAVPTDESLVDYLLGEPTDGEPTDGEPMDGEPTERESIERWLAADEAHVLRLERLAEVVLVMASHSGVVVSPSQALPVQVVSARRWLSRSLVAVAAVAAAVGGMVIGTPWRGSSGPVDQHRLAVAWSEVFASELPLLAMGDFADPSQWEVAPWREDSLAIDADIDPALDGWMTDRGLADEGLMADEAFAAGNDSPPDWLLVAVTQMDGQSATSDSRTIGDEALDQQELR